MKSIFAGFEDKKITENDLILRFNFAEQNSNKKIETNSSTRKRMYKQKEHEVKKPTAKSDTKWF